METQNKSKKIFLTGAMGYIGGAVLNKLLEPSYAGRWEITALIRSEESAPKLRELGVTPLIGNLDDTDILIKAASDADVVMHLADADHLGAAKAFVKGCQTLGKNRIYIQTSGTGILADDAKGDYTSDKVYSDLDMKGIHSIPKENPHRDVDIYLFDNCEGFDLIIVCPPTIHGVGKGPGKRLSHQMPLLIRGFLKAGVAGTVGKGINIWNHVNINDLADFYVWLLERALEGKASTGKDGFYFCESGEHKLKDVVTKIGEHLYNRKLIKQAEPVQFKPEEVEEYLGSVAWWAIGCNSRGRAERARSQGWKESGLVKTIYDTIDPQVEAILAEKSK